MSLSNITQNEVNNNIFSFICATFIYYLLLYLLLHCAILSYFKQS